MRRPRPARSSPIPPPRRLRDGSAAWSALITQANNAAHASADAEPSSTGVSQFLSRVLEQLSLSSWLPAAMLVGNGAVLLQMRIDHSTNLATALRRLTEKPIGTLTVLVFALLLTAIVMQAFEFELIRLLEGYSDSNIQPVRALIRVRIRRHERVRRIITTERDKVERKALKNALRNAQLYEPPLDPDTIEALRVRYHTARNWPYPHEATAEVRNILDHLDWRTFVRSSLLYRLDALDARLRWWPLPHRIMPTRLGNTLRAAEDRLNLDGDLENYVIRHLDGLPPSLRKEHRDFRTRLDLYCGLVIVFWMLIPVSITMLLGIAPIPVLCAVAGGYAILAAISYLASITSARGYGGVLAEINNFVRKPDAKRRQ